MPSVSERNGRDRGDDEAEPESTRRSRRARSRAVSALISWSIPVRREQSPSRRERLAAEAVLQERTAIASIGPYMNSVKRAKKMPRIQVVRRVTMLRPRSRSFANRSMRGDADHHHEDEDERARRGGREVDVRVLRADVRCRPTAPCRRRSVRTVANSPIRGRRRRRSRSARRAARAEARPRGRPGAATRRGRAPPSTAARSMVASWKKIGVTMNST